MVFTLTVLVNPPFVVFQYGLDLRQEVRGLELLDGVVSAADAYQAELCPALTSVTFFSVWVTPSFRQANTQLKQRVNERGSAVPTGLDLKPLVTQR